MRKFGTVGLNLGSKKGQIGVRRRFLVFLGTCYSGDIWLVNSERGRFFAFSRDIKCWTLGAIGCSFDGRRSWVKNFYSIYRHFGPPEVNFSYRTRNINIPHN